MPYTGAGGQKFMSSVLAKASMPGGYSVTRRATSQEMAKHFPNKTAGSNVSTAARSALQKAMGRYKPGGSFGAGIEAGLERGRVKSMSAGMQNLVSAGLAGTTIAGGLGKKYEEEVAAPTRANLEGIRAERLSGLETILAQMEEGGYQSQLGRQFQASQSTLNRPQSSISSYTPSLPGRSPTTGAKSQLGGSYAPTIPSMESITSSFRKAQGRQPSRSSQSSQSYRQPGSVAMVANGERWVYDDMGIPVRESQYNAPRAF